ncbi:hypothetical protein [Sphingobacterium sp. R2]|uniref:hypothetical protein n=1 Tax=Sphingobacterium sp. R2 TaxID=3112958 RepID=UPI00345CBD19
MDFEIMYSEKKETLMVNGPIKNNHYTLLLCETGAASIQIGYHQFELVPNIIAILSPDQLFSISNISENLHVKQVMFTKISLHKIFLKDNIVEELLTLNSKYPPAYDLNEKAPLDKKLKLSPQWGDNYIHNPKTSEIPL